MPNQPGARSTPTFEDFPKPMSQRWPHSLRPTGRETEHPLENLYRKHIAPYEEHRNNLRERGVKHGAVPTPQHRWQVPAEIISGYGLEHLEVTSPLWFKDSGSDATVRAQHEESEDLFQKRKYSVSWFKPVEPLPTILKRDLTDVLDRLKELDRMLQDMHADTEINDKSRKHVISFLDRNRDIPDPGIVVDDEDGSLGLSWNLNPRGSVAASFHDGQSVEFAIVIPNASGSRRQWLNGYIDDVDLFAGIFQLIRT